MKSIHFFVLTLAMLCACQPSKQSNMYTVTGELDDSTHHGKKIYIMRLDDNKYIDSTFVEGKQFVFRGKVDTASYCRVDVSYSDFSILILERGDIKVNLKEHISPSGTSLNDELRRICQEEDSIQKHVSQKQEEIRNQHSDDIEAREAIGKFVNEVKASLLVRCKDIYNRHNNDVVGYSQVHSYSMRWLDTNTQLQIMSTFGPWLKSQKSVQAKIKRLEALNKTSEGMPFIDIKGVDADGNPVALSDYIGKGNYVLLDMWASWCGPCKGEIPYLLKLHNQYKGKGLTVLGLFVWDKKENLKKAVEEEGIVWPQIVNVEGMEVTDSYGVDGIPHIILFAPDGTILKRDLRAQGLIDTVAEVMKKN